MFRKGTRNADGRFHGVVKKINYGELICRSTFIHGVEVGYKQWYDGDQIYNLKGLRS